MTTRDILTLRLIRLHPLMILRVLLGLVSYLYDPFAGKGQDVPWQRLLIALALGLLPIPAPTLANRLLDLRNGLTN